ncbi:TSUP family transporter [Gordonia liuliyuniae]|uniref:Probable membrane transporter protein n=1 Tax=Gordonia liuliyuniae TaxID=2911517 RepID=A0ABS9ITJ5_9ACTN|nr:TSUP family transporter [Gordonia liuliyuniae]MCF8588887.1 TSUP family transporter [Gordonia liuliyuniae]
MPLLSLLVGGALVAGWMDAVVGGGGLVLLPLLLIAFPNAVPAAALGTNKLTAFWGTATAAVLYLRRVEVNRRIVAISVPLAGLCAVGGALAASAVSSDMMRPFVIAAMLAVGAFVALRPQFGATRESFAPVSRTRFIVAVCTLAVIGFYDGVFGPGTGLFLIITLTALLHQSFLQSAAMAKVANTATNVGALAVFASQGHVMWLLGAILAVANIAGSVVGSRLVLGSGTKIVRYALLVIVVVMAAKLSYDQFT